MSSPVITCEHRMVTDFRVVGLVLTRLPAGSQRGGILGHASVLTLTSNGVETSPVVRGVWVLDHFLGTPPPPPPKEVPALVPDLNGAQSVRQMLEKHRSDPACMKCHQRMDPSRVRPGSLRSRRPFPHEVLEATEGQHGGSVQGRDFQ